MSTKSSRNWKSTPGAFDVLHSREIFSTDGNEYDIPSVPHAPLAFTPQWIAPYRTRIRTKRGMAGGAAHFFLDDYRFESVWSRPDKALQYLRRYQTLFTPDFSLYSDWPLALQLWNTYRSRWCGARWHKLGFQVIPTVSWSTAESYDFCFVGISQRSVIAISTLGSCRGIQDRIMFANGFNEMLLRLRPSRVLCYGQIAPELATLTDVKVYEARWGESESDLTDASSANGR